MNREYNRSLHNQTIVAGAAESAAAGNNRGIFILCIIIPPQTQNRPNEANECLVYCSMLTQILNLKEMGEERGKWVQAVYHILSSACHHTSFSPASFIIYPGPRLKRIVL